MVEAKCRSIQPNVMQKTKCLADLLRALQKKQDSRKLEIGSTTQTINTSFIDAKSQLKANRYMVFWCI